MSGILEAPRPYVEPGSVGAQIYELGRALHSDGRYSDALRAFVECVHTTIAGGSQLGTQRATAAILRIILDDVLFEDAGLDDGAITAIGLALSAMTRSRFSASFRGDWSMALLCHALLSRTRPDQAMQALQAAARMRREAGVARDPAEGLVSAVIHEAAGSPVPFGCLLTEPIGSVPVEYRAWSLRTHAAQELRRGNMTSALNASSAAVGASWSVLCPVRQARLETLASRQRSKVLHELGRHPEAVELEALAIVLDAALRLPTTWAAGPGSASTD